MTFADESKGTALRFHPHEIHHFRVIAPGVDAKLFYPYGHDYLAMSTIYSDDQITKMVAENINETLGVIRG